MKKSLLVSVSFLLIFKIYAAEKVTLELSNAKLSTIVDAVSQINKINIIWDKDAIAKRDKLVSLTISKPMDSLQILNMTLLQNGLIIIPDKKFNILYVKESDEFSVVLPPDVVAIIGTESFYKLLDYIKSIKTENAIFDYNLSAYSIYYKDIKENILKVKLFADTYVRYLQDISLKQKEVFEKKGKPIRKEYKFSYEDYKSIESEIQDSLSSYGRVFYERETGKLVVVDFSENIQKIIPIILRKMKTKIVTKCFYIRELEPGEIYDSIKYSELSEVGTILFKTKDFDVATILTETYNKPDKDNPISVTTLQKELKLEDSSKPSKLEGDYLVSKLPRVCISDYPEVIDKIKYKYSNVLLERPYQILIEARIVEISSDSIKDLGIQWGGQGVDGNFSISGTNSPSSMLANSRYAVDFPATSSNFVQGFSLGFVYGTINNFIDVRISALEKIGKTKLLSAPKVLTSDGETAIIRQGYEIPYFSGATATTPSNVRFKNVALQLKVTPFTFVDSNILLNIELSKNEPDFTKQVLGFPSIRTKTIINRVSVKDGQIVVIGGILEKKESDINSGVPGLMNIPIFGNLFKNNYKQSNSTELLIFISPKIVYE